MVAGDTRVVPDATVADYALLQRRLGTSRVVVVQPSTYGTDNRCLVEALGQLGPSARGIAVVDTLLRDAELEALAEAGVRGIRFNIARGGATSVEMIEPLARHVASLGWHVQIHMGADAIASHETLWERLPVPIVFDHMARIPAREGQAHPTFHVMRRLLETGRVWVKVSGAYLVSTQGPPDYADVTSLVQALCDTRLDRVVWGSDWPHPSQAVKPDDAALLSLLKQWLPDATSQRRVLVENAEALYGF